jgi:prepilin-type N-terminal cleavage/methylation domain-containing protein
VLGKICNNDKGITLIELLIALSIIGILLATTFAFFLFGNKTFSMGSSQYSTQADLRFASDYVVKSIRYSTAITLSSTIPSSIAQTDKYDYIYISGNSLIHSAYNNNDTRLNHTISSGLLSSSSFWSEKNLNSQMVGLSLNGIENNQNFDLQSNIALPNIELKKSYIANTSNAKSIKFIVDKSLNTTITPPPPPPPPPPSEQPFVTATVRITSNNNRVYRITLNSIPKLTTENGPHYTASFSVVSNDSYPLKVERKLNDGNYQLVGNYTFDVEGTDITKEISD